MREIVTAVEMKELDHNTIQKAGISSPVLMERAALKTVEEIVQRLKNKEKEKILVVCGTGNNGGDGLAIARLLQLRGVRTWYYIAGKEEKMTAETAGQLKTAEYYQVPRVHNLDPDEYTTIVDAIFGVGLSRPVEGKYAELISTMNRASAYKVAVDIPSGIDSDTGFEKGIAFRADLTVTFAFRKRGLCFYPGRMYGGEIIVEDIGIYPIPGEKICMHHLEQRDLEMLPERVPYGNKSKDTVLRFSRQIVRFLKTQEVKAIVIACNTASAYALPDIEKEIDIPIIGVVRPGAKVAAQVTQIAVSRSKAAGSLHLMMANNPVFLIVRE